MRRLRSGTARVVTSSPWVLVTLGVVVMVVLLVVALGAYRARTPARDALPAPVPDATMSLPELPPSSTAGDTAGPPPPVRPGLSPRSTVLPRPTTAAPAAPTGGNAGAVTVPPPVPSSAPPAPAPPPPSPPPTVTGSYRVLDRFDGGFIGEVLVSNASGDPQGWTVRLTFPYARLVTAWIEGAPQGGVSRSGDTWTFTSGVDLAPGASVPLRFHFERGGTDTRPSRCTTNDTPCAEPPTR
ncbi:cellulose binding domain-containing protein [Micromonospora sp. PLK6-60]|uniref:cellulose binding domain-containing protein n=1 Tax=Micromonospora sp. PLK6-60 TaxID=2873383 RepID=UPI00210690C7|nr:cellulose binding domain-containing protein [Micromonospora sp. PLK6-60]